MKGVLKEAGDKQEQEKKWIKEWAVRGSSDSLGIKTMNEEKRQEELVNRDEETVKEGKGKMGKRKKKIRS